MSAGTAKGKQMTKTMIRLVGGAVVLAVLALFGRGAASPVSADPAAVVMFNPTICVAVGGTDPGPINGCGVNQDGLKFAPAGGNGMLMDAADRLGDNDGEIEASDFAGVAEFTGGQVHQQGGAVDPSFSRLAILAFVNSDGPVTFHSTAGTFFSSGTQTWVCDGNPVLDNPDSDCDGTPSAPATPGHKLEDHVVVAYLSCTFTTCPTRGEENITVEQGGIVFPTTFKVVGEAVNVTFFTLEAGVQAGVAVDGALDSDSAAAACPFSATLSFITKALAEAEKTVIVARANDIDGTAISGAWFQWSVDDPHHNTTDYFNEQGILAQPVTPTLNLGGFGYGAPNILCAPAGAAAGDVTVTARIVRSYGGQPFDPLASPGVDPAHLNSTLLSYGNTTFTVNAIPATLTLSAVPAEIACDGTATSTVSASLTDASGNAAIGGTAVHFDTQVLATANPINANTDDKGVATSVISPLASDVRGVPVTVSVKAGTSWNLRSTTLPVPRRTSRETG